MAEKRDAQLTAGALASMRVIFQPVAEWLDLCNVGYSASIPETLPQTVEEAGIRSARRNRAALTELAKW